jgi:replicative DNA helicase
MQSLRVSTAASEPTRIDRRFDLRLVHDLAAEHAVLACVLLDPGRTAEAAMALEPADFADEANRTIYEAMLRLHSAGKPVNVALLVGELRN